MKNTLFALLGFILVSTSLAASAAQFGDFTYTSDAYVVAITGYTGPGGAVTIPATIGALPVITIGNSAFEGKTSTTSITIPSSVTTIGSSAFVGCASLTSITIPNSVISIGDQAFAGCTSLTSITIPGSVRNIGDLPFYDCTRLISISVQATNEYYSSLAGVLFDKSQTTLIECPAGKTGSYAIPGSVITIGNYAFYHCANLTGVMIPDRVNDIGWYAFHFCTGLTGITIPASVSIIGSRSFWNCDSLIAITVDAANPVYSSLNGVVFNKDQTILITFPGGRTGSYAIPGGVTSIDDAAFHTCYNLTSVTIPGSVTSLGFGTFFACTSLTSIKIPGSVTRIEGYTFSYCSSLSSVAIPGSVTYIGDQAFVSCTTLTSVTIPSSVISIGYGAFINCSSLKGIFFKGDPPNFFPSVDSSYVFDGATNVIAYYLPGTTGWGTTLAGRPVKLWNPLMQTSSVGPAGFGFNIIGTADIPIVVEVSRTLAPARWVGVRSLNLTNGAFHFSDPNWAHDLARFYRIRSP